MRTVESRLFHLAVILRLGLAGILIGTPTFAAVVTWSDASGGSSFPYYTDSGNWNPSVLPSLTSDVVFPTLGASGSTYNVLNDNQFAVFNCNSITFDTTNTINFNTQFPPTFLRNLVINSGDITRTAASSGDQTIKAMVKLNQSALWNINGTGFLIVHNVDETVAGLTLTKTGNGTVSLGGTAGYTGTTTVSNGLLFASDLSLGSGNVIVNSGGSFLPTGTVNRSLTLNGTGFGGLGALRSESGLAGWAGPIFLNTNSSIGVDSGSLSISGSIDDGTAKTLTKFGAGTLILSAANTYNGATTVSAGELWAAHASAMGTGNVTVNSGASLVVPDGVSTGANVAFITGMGDGAEGAMRSQTGVGTWGGGITLTANSSLGALAGSELVITGAIGQTTLGLGYTKVAPGKVSLTNIANNTGSTSVASGILNLRHSSALGTAGASVSPGATLSLQETLAAVPITVTRLVSLDGTGFSGAGALRNLSGNNTWSGPVALLTASNIGVDADTLTISGAISGAFTLTKVGLGTLNLSNTGNSFSHAIVDEGTLTISTANALPPSSTVTILDGGAFKIAGGLTVNRTLFLNGSGVAESGALLNTSGVNAWSAPITLQSHSSFGVAAGELRLTAAIDGGGGLFKVGPGKLSLTAANSYTGPTNVMQGILSIENSSGIPPASIPFVAEGAAIELRNGVTLINNLGLASNGILGGGGLRNANGSNTWSGNVTLVTNDAAIGADAGTQLTVSGIVTDLGNVFPLTKVGGGTLVLSSPNEYDGGTLINGGTLSISADNNLGLPGSPVTHNNGGKLLVSANMTSGRTFNLNTGALQVAGGATLTYSGATVNGGFLRGPGTHAIGANSSFNGVTALAGNTIVQSSSTTLSNFTNSGSLTSNAPLTWDGGYNTAAGAININNTFNTTAFENAGAININNGGTLTNTSNNFVSGGGSHMNINAGGTLNVSGNALELNGALLVNNGAITGTTNVNFGSLAKGAGVYGAVNVSDGGRFSPGNSPGSVTTGPTNWRAGGTYTVEIADASAGPGIGWDLWNVAGSLSLDSSGRFVIDLLTLSGDTAGPAAGFDLSKHYHWLIARADNGLGQFDLAAIALDTSSFGNPTGSGQFSVSADGNALYVNFSPVPEVSSLAAIALAAALSSYRRKRR